MSSYGVPLLAGICQPQRKMENRIRDWIHNRQTRTFSKRLSSSCLQCFGSFSSPLSVAPVKPMGPEEVSYLG